MWALSILYSFTKTLPAVIDSNFVSVCVYVFVYSVCNKGHFEVLP